METVANILVFGWIYTVVACMTLLFKIIISGPHNCPSALTIVITGLLWPVTLPVIAFRGLIYFCHKVMSFTSGITLADIKKSLQEAFE